jgi:hypothetical protein
MDTASVTILIAASFYAMMTLMSLVLIARRVSMLDYCLKELEKKMPILIPSDLHSRMADLVQPEAQPAPEVKLEVPASGLTSPIGSIELAKPAVAKSVKKSKTKSSKKGKK